MRTIDETEVTAVPRRPINNGHIGAYLVVEKGYPPEVVEMLNCHDGFDPKTPEWTEILDDLVRKGCMGRATWVPPERYWWVAF